VSKVKVQSFAISLDGFGAGPGIDMRALGYDVVEHIRGERAMRVIVRRRP
jgi:hypothetical protein